MDRHPILPRIEARSVVVENGCKEWTGYIAPTGYGMLRVDGLPCGAHRAAWIAHHGPIPQGMYVCHHCDNPKCVNVEHLFIGTAADNNWDKVRKGRGGYEYRRNPGNKVTHRRGSANSRALFTDEQVADIRSRFTGRRGQQLDLAAEYGVSPSVINRLVLGKTYGAA